MRSLLLERFDQWRFVQLSITFVALMIVMPELDQYILLKALASLFLLNALLVAISAHAGRIVRVVLWTLWGITVTASVVEELPIGPPARLACHVATVIALSTTVIVCCSRILRVVFHADRVTVDSIFGSIVAYQLIGLFFAGVYTLLMLADPGSFRGAGVASAAPSLLQNDMAYYSFVTLATLGYGDIVPVSSVARSIAITEALVGQFYVAVVVALLIGAYLSRRYKGR